MVNHSLDATFAALADPTRRAILARLALGEASIKELAEPFEMSLPAVLKHVGALQDAGLVHARKEGRVRRCQIEAAPLQAAGEWIDRYRRFWEERFDALAEYLRRTGGPGVEQEDEPWRHSKEARRTEEPSSSGSRARSRRRGSGSSGPSRTRRRSRSGS